MEEETHLEGVCGPGGHEPSGAADDTTGLDERIEGTTGEAGDDIEGIQALHGLLATCAKRCDRLEGTNLGQPGSQIRGEMR